MAIETRFKQGTIVFGNWQITEYIGNGSGGYIKEDGRFYQWSDRREEITDGN